MKPLLRVENVTKIFGPNSERALHMVRNGKSKADILQATGATVAVYQANFSVEQGEFFVIMGLSGSGKSTLVRCLNRLIEPSSGHIFIGESDITTADPAALREIRRRRIAMVFQHFALFPHLSIIENAAYGLKVMGVGKAERHERAMTVLEQMELAGWADADIADLSGGMQQRVGLARALVTEPDILLMDEPFSALDPLIRRDMQDVLIRLQTDLKKTIVFITHDLDEALKLGDRIAVMKDGVFHQIGTPEEILQDPATGYVAQFIEGVNPQHVLTARHVMQKPDALVRVNDGPRVALRKMQANGLSSVFVVDRERRYRGLVLVDDAIAAIDRGETDLGEIVTTDLAQVGPDTSLDELVAIGAEARYPVPVVDDDTERLLGIIVRVSILTGLVARPASDKGQNEEASD